MRLGGKAQRNAEEAVEHLQAEAELGRIDRGRLLKRLVELEIAPARRREVEAAATDASALRLWYERQPRTEETRAALGERYHAMFLAGERPLRREAAEAFYLLAIEWAERARRPDEMSTLLDALRGWVREAGGSQASLRPLEERLERLRRSRR